MCFRNVWSDQTTDLIFRNSLSPSAIFNENFIFVLVWTTAVASSQICLSITSAGKKPVVVNILETRRVYLAFVNYFYTVFFQIPVIVGNQKLIANDVAKVFPISFEYTFLSIRFIFWAVLFATSSHFSLMIKQIRWRLPFPK